MQVMETSKQITETPPITEVDRARWALREKWSWVESSIWTDSMLIALGNGVKGGKWFSLIDKTYRPQVLENAWLKIKSNKGAGGVDNISIHKFAANKDRYLEELANDLKSETYKPQAVKRKYILKEKGKFRPLGLPTIKDKIAQQAIKVAIEPIFENEFLDTSYGFRPNRGAKTAIAEVNNLIDQGYVWVLDADIKAYFDTIPHENLLKKIKRRISDRRIIGLIEMWLKQTIMEECKNWIPTEGTAQGGVISPLLANIYLHDLDVTLKAAKYKMIRYADDFVVLTKTKEDAENALMMVQEWMTEHELNLHPEKTRIGNCMVIGEGFDFLGYRFELGTTWVRKKSIQKFRDRIRQKTSKVCGKAIKEVIKELNPILRGWCNYFKDVTKYTLGTFDSFVRRRLRAIMQKQNKKKSFGAGWCNMTIPNKFFASNGLINMEDLQRQYLACQS